MFEKSLYDLIRGLRNHKGREREYIQDSLRECWKEIRTQDMDLKATALLKLTYLEMFGHDMTSASFHVLEVMSSPKYLQKRAGYLAAVQSFRPDTEVLMLAENLLKKDLTSSSPPTISLPLIAIPHVINPSMANSLLSDLLPRLSHSHASIRKKTIVTLYRLALVYPETLRPAWPKLRERLLDVDEDSSVTAAVVNVVCELGWRRPQDFLPLAPRLFELLVEGGNNWMSIKIIKLFAVLTPLEPRLVKKLLPQLTSVLKTTPAMSLMYECINGIIQGGILDSAAQTSEGDEVARLCVGKLRGMLVIEGDPNLKYVALLAFNRIVKSHAGLISQHDDVIMECLDDGDVSIRLRALDLVVGMVNHENLIPIVERLLRQLRQVPSSTLTDNPSKDRGAFAGIIPSADLEYDDPEQSIRSDDQKSNQIPHLPDEYCSTVIQKILDMCSSNTYENITDFEWYINILVQLVRHVPASSTLHSTSSRDQVESSERWKKSSDLAYRIGYELRNLAVRVRSSRANATLAAERLVAVDQRGVLFPPSGNEAQGVLQPVVWIVGEFAEYLCSANATLTSLLESIGSSLASGILTAYLQAIPKVFSSVIRHEHANYTHNGRVVASVLIARVLHALEPLAYHSNLEVQERAVEYLELMRLVSEAVTNQSIDNDGTGLIAPSLLLSEVMPSLFSGAELKPVAPGAQKKVPLPMDLDLDIPINDKLSIILKIPDLDVLKETQDDFHKFYNQRQHHQLTTQPAANRLNTQELELSYQQAAADLVDPEWQAKKRAERLERNRDDPFYIAGQDRSGMPTPMSNRLKTNNGEGLDLDSIPIVALNLEGEDINVQNQGLKVTHQRQKNPPKFEILADENIGDGQFSTEGGAATGSLVLADVSGKKSLLQVDSSGLGSFALDDTKQGILDVERREAEEAEMTKALQEVERLRREMQRASERIQSKTIPIETAVKRKKKARIVDLSAGEVLGSQTEDRIASVVVKKERKKKPADPTCGADAGAKIAIPEKKREKKKKKNNKEEREAILED